MPADIRDGLKQAMDEATAYANTMANQFNERDRKLIDESGKARIQVLTKDDVAAWRRAMEPVWQKFEKDIGKDLIDAALKANNP